MDLCFSVTDFPSVQELLALLMSGTLPYKLVFIGSDIEPLYPAVLKLALDQDVIVKR